MRVWSGMPGLPEEMQRAVSAGRRAAKKTRYSPHMRQDPTCRSSTARCSSMSRRTARSQAGMHDLTALDQRPQSVGAARGVPTNPTRLTVTVPTPTIAAAADDLWPRNSVRSVSNARLLSEQRERRSQPATPRDLRRESPRTGPAGDPVVDDSHAPHQRLASARLIARPQTAAKNHELVLRATAVNVVCRVLRQSQLQRAEQLDDVPQFDDLIHYLHEVLPLLAHPLRQVGMGRARDQRTVGGEKPPQLDHDLESVDLGHMLEYVEQADDIEAARRKARVQDRPSAEGCLWDHRARQSDRWLAVVDAGDGSEARHERAHHPRAATEIEDAVTAARSTNDITHQELQLLVPSVGDPPIAQANAQRELVVEAFNSFSFHRTSFHCERCYQRLRRRQDREGSQPIPLIASRRIQDLAKPVPSDRPEDQGGETVPVKARRRLVAGASAALLGQVATVAGNLVTSIFIAKMFGPDGTGAYALIANLFAAIVLLAALGLPTGITFLVSRGSWSARAALRESFLAALPMGIGGAALGLGFYALTVDSILDGTTLLEAVTVMAVVPLGLAWLFCGSIAIARDLYEQFAFYQLSRAILTGVIVVTLGIPFGLSGAIAGFAAAQGLSAAVSVAALRRHVRDEHVEPKLDEDGSGPLRTALRFGRRAWSADVLQFLNYRLDLFILAGFASRTDVGRYALAVSLTMLAWLAPAAIGQVLLPRTARLDSAAAAGRMARQEADDAAARVIRHTVLLQLPTAIAVAALLLIGVPLIYGPPFHDTIALGFWLLPGVLIASVAKVVSPVVAGRGHPIYLVYNVLITVPVTVALYFVMIPSLGATGAAIASSASYTLTTVLAMYFYRRVTGNSIRGALLPTAADVREYRLMASHLFSWGQSRLPGNRRCTS
jgi:O-antigen/teichoic acid export membrane protein